MIYIHNFEISDDATEINVHVETDESYIITSALLWTEDTYKDYDEAIDLTSKLLQTSNEEEFIITTTDVGIDTFNGIYFIEFETSSPTVVNCDSCTQTIGVAASLIPYRTCQLNIIREFSACNDMRVNSICGTSDYNTIINIEILLRAITTALMYGYYEEAIDYLNAIKKLCNTSSCLDCTHCDGCSELSNFAGNTGLNFLTVGNDFTLV